MTEDDEMGLDTRRMLRRVAVSVVIAVFAYLGLLLGGDVINGPARQANAVSSSSKDSQPLQVSARDVVRGILAADRKAAHTYASYDSSSGALVEIPSPGRLSRHDLFRVASFESPLRAVDAKAYQPRGPPTLRA